VIRAMAIAAGLALTGPLAGNAVAVTRAATEAPSVAPSTPPLPVLAYYYIWFDQSSWARAKIDQPVLGRYSSDDESVIRQHVAAAKKAGITGFLVSWKGSDTLDRRLATLVRVAHEEQFKLGIVYEGLDFGRDPLPVSKVGRDLEAFADRYANYPAFQIFARPLVIWAGTWRFDSAAITSVTRKVRSRLLVLASEKSVEGYQRVAPMVDGNAYYWSSVNPETFTHYSDRLSAFGAAVHTDRGLWIAPAAPGFDARLVGGTTIVDRNDGSTLRREIDAAVKSSPDALGVISWNEFSENTHIEPSQHYGSRYLDLLRDLTSTIAAKPPASAGADFDSSEPNGRGDGRGLLIGVAALLIVGSALAVRGRRFRADSR